MDALAFAASVSEGHTEVLGSPLAVARDSHRGDADAGKSEAEHGGARAASSDGPSDAHALVRHDAAHAATAQRAETQAAAAAAPAVNVTFLETLERAEAAAQAATRAAAEALRLVQQARTAAEAEAAQAAAAALPAVPPPAASVTHAGDARATQAPAPPARLDVETTTYDERQLGPSWQGGPRLWVEVRSFFVAICTAAAAGAHER